MRNMHAERAVLVSRILSIVFSGNSEYTAKQDFLRIILILFVRKFLLACRRFFVENGRY